jgi:serine/threonine protein kinase
MSKNAYNIPEFIKSYKIEKEAYHLSYGTLYTAINKDINEKVLIHVFPKEIIKEKANEVTFMNNHVYLMKLVNHKNILKLYEIIETKTHAFLVFEYFEGVKLSDYISKKKKLNEDDSMIIFKEIINILVYLHEMYLCNLNINSNNIIIDTKNNIKICDFKFGHFYTNKEKSRTTLIGDHFSTCPELLSKKPYNPELADIWSSGVLLYQMVTGELPFHSQKELDLIRLIIKGDYTLPNSVSEKMKNLIKGLLELKEEQRFKINDLFNQQIIKDKNITKASLTQGLNVLIEKYPIDGVVLNICKKNFGIDAGQLIKCLQNNKFTPITSIFKQIVTKLSKKGIQTINDLSSSKFIAYLSDSKNNLKEEVQINNIQNYLKKEEEIKKNSQDVAAILLNNQNEISKGLYDLKRQYEDEKRGGVRRTKRGKSFDNYNRKALELDNDQNNNNKDGKNPLENNQNDNNVAKRNTVLIPDLTGLGKGKDKEIGKIAEKFKKEDEKPIEEIKEEEEEKKDVNDVKSDSSSSSSSNSDNEEEKDVKKEKKKEVKKEAKKEVKKEVKV